MSGSWDETREAYAKRMEADGFKIVYPAANELQIDIDTEEQYALLLKQVEVFNRNYKAPFDGDLHCSPPIQLKVWPSTSGKPERRHASIALPFNVDRWQRIAWQAAFGSDPLREMLSLFRALGGDETPGLFVEAGDA